MSKKNKKKHKNKNTHNHNHAHNKHKQTDTTVSKQSQEEAIRPETLDAQIIEKEIESTTAQIANLSPNTPATEGGVLHWKAFWIGLAIGAILTFIFL